jgi:hypothetical protein
VTAPVPDLEWRRPPCPECGRETTGDDTAVSCEGCALEWNADGTHGRRDESPIVSGDIVSGARARRCLRVGAIVQWVGSAAGSYKPEHLRRHESAGRWHPMIDTHSLYRVVALE